MSGLERQKAYTVVAGGENARTVQHPLGDLGDQLQTLGTFV